MKGRGSDSSTRFGGFKIKPKIREGKIPQFKFQLETLLGEETTLKQDEKKIINGGTMLVNLSSVKEKWQDEYIPWPTDVFCVFKFALDGIECDSHWGFSTLLSVAIGYTPTILTTDAILMAFLPSIIRSSFSFTELPLPNGHFISSFNSLSLLQQQRFTHPNTKNLLDQPRSIP